MGRGAVDELVREIVAFVPSPARGIVLFVDRVEYRGRQVPGVRVEYSCFDRDTPHVGSFVPKVICAFGKYRAARGAAINSLSLIAEKTRQGASVRDNLNQEYDRFSLTLELSQQYPLFFLDFLELPLLTCGFFPLS